MGSRVGSIINRGMAFLGGVLCFLVACLLVAGFVRIGLIPWQAFMSLPILLVATIAASQILPLRFAALGIFGLALILSDGADGCSDASRPTRGDFLGVALLIIHFLAWFGLVCLAFIVPSGIAFWSIIAVSSAGTLFPLALQSRSKAKGDR